MGLLEGARESVLRRCGREVGEDGLGVWLWGRGQAVVVGYWAGLDVVFGCFVEGDVAQGP